IGVGVFQPVRVVGVRIGFAEPTQVDRDRLHLVEGGVGVGFTQRQDVRCQTGGRVAFRGGAGGLGVADELVLRVDLVVDGFQRLGAGRAGIDRGGNQAVGRVVGVDGLFLGGVGAAGQVAVGVVGVAALLGGGIAPAGIGVVFGFWICILVELIRAF